MTWSMRMEDDDVVMACTRDDDWPYSCFPLKRLWMYSGGTYRWYNQNKAHVMGFPLIHFSNRRVER